MVSVLALIAVDCGFEPNFKIGICCKLLASLKKMSLAKHGKLYFILASTYFSPLAILASV
jgi:hypothetical protein